MSDLNECPGACAITEQQVKKLQSSVTDCHTQATHQIIRKLPLK